MSNSKFFIEKLKSNKLSLYFSLGFTLTVELLLSVMLFSNGLAFSTGLPVIISALLGIVMIAFAINTNFRFGYGVIVPVIYVVGLACCTVATVFGVGKGVFTVTAAVLYSALHFGAIAVTLINVFNAVKLGRGLNFVSIIFSVVFVAICLAYAGVVFVNGLFGQGGFGYKNVLYTYSREYDGFVATPLDGRGQKIKILNTFDGEKVVAIDGNVLFDENLTDAELYCDKDFSLIVEDVQGINDKISVKIDKKDIDEVKERFVNLCKTDWVNRSEYLQFYNMLTPSGLDGEERFITFNYSYEDLQYCNFKVLKTWIGKKGDVFDFVAHAKGVDYAENYDLHNEEFLKQNYERGAAGKVLSPLRYNGNLIIDETVNSDMPRVAVYFEYVRKIIVEEDNDEKFDFYTNNAEFSKSGAERYVLADDPFGFLSDVNPREGFSLSWKYSNAYTSTPVNFAKLKDVLSSGDVTIYPEWKLNEPTVELTSDKDNNTYTYGDAATIGSTVTPPTNGINLQYEWSFNGSKINEENSSSYSITKVKPAENTGEYTLKVTAGNDETTSLTSENSARINLTVNKKQVQAEWNVPREYDGTDQGVKVEKFENIVDGDVISGNIKINDGTLIKGFNTTVKNAGTYTATVIVDDTWKNYYDFGNSICNFKVCQKPVTLSWEEKSFTYNGENQHPEASSTDVVGGDNLQITYSGYGKNKGNYTVTATVGNSNYIIDANASNEYVINAKPVTLSWEEKSFTYNGENQHPEASSTDVVGGDNLQITYSGYGKNKGNYTVTATVGNCNYIIGANASNEYVINAKSVTLNWTNTEFTYNGKNQRPTATVNGVVNGDGVNLSYDIDGKVEAGEYKIKITSLGNDNYQLSAQVSTAFNIKKAALTVTAKNKTISVGDEPSNDGVTYSGFVNGETQAVLQGSLSYSYSYVKGDAAGSYTITVSGVTADNYDITFVGGTLTVEEKAE